VARLFFGPEDMTRHWSGAPPAEEGLRELQLLADAEPLAFLDHGAGQGFPLQLRQGGKLK
jgi:hypothetical protein